MDDVYKYFVTIMRQWAPKTTLILQCDIHKIRQNSDGLTKERSILHRVQQAQFSKMSEHSQQV